MRVAIYISLAFMITACAPQQQNKQRDLSPVFTMPVTRTIAIKQYHKQKHNKVVKLTQNNATWSWQTTVPTQKMRINAVPHKVASKQPLLHRTTLCTKGNETFINLKDHSEKKLVPKTLKDLQDQLATGQNLIKLTDSSKSWRNWKGPITPCQHKIETSTRVQTLNNQATITHIAKLDEHTVENKTTITFSPTFDTKKYKSTTMHSTQTHALLGWYEKHQGQIHHLTRLEFASGKMQRIDLSNGGQIALSFLKHDAKKHLHKKHQPPKTTAITWLKLDAKRIVLQYAIPDAYDAKRPSHIQHLAVLHIDGTITHLKDNNSLAHVSYGVHPKHKGIIFTSAIISNECKGAYIISDDNKLTCLKRIPPSQLMLRKNHQLKDDRPVHWQEPLPDNWKLEHLMSHQTGLYSRLIGPDGVRYSFGKNTRCTEQIAFYTNNQGKLHLRCIRTSGIKQEKLLLVLDQKTKTAYTERRQASNITSVMPGTRGFGRHRYTTYRQNTLGQYTTYFQFSGHAHLAFEQYDAETKLPKWMLLYKTGEDIKLVQTRPKKGSYDVLKKYTSKECPQELSPGKIGLTNGRFIVVYCSQSTSKHTNPKLIWSEVLDTKTRRVWRTQDFISHISDGSILTQDTKTMNGDDVAQNTIISAWP